MKKRILPIVLVLTLLVGGATAAFGSSQNDALVSKSYLEGSYYQELQTMTAERAAAAVRGLYDAALQDLNSVGQAYLDRLGAGGGMLPGEGWLSAASFTVQGGERDDTITLADGSGLVWTSGSAVVSGTLIDVTAGSRVSNGTLTASHRYVASGQCVITVSSRTAHWAAEGMWRTTSDGISVPEVELTFKDVPEGIWYYDAVYYVVGKGLFLGKSDTAFAPHSEMSRCMLATVLHRLAGEPPVTYKPMFRDVPDGTWYTVGSIWAAENNIASGKGDGTFGPTENLSRQELVMMLYHYANWYGCDTTQRADLSKFPDGGQVSGEARDAVSWAVSVGILQGGTGGQLLLSETTGRAQVATMIWRFTNWISE